MPSATLSNLVKLSLAYAIIISLSGCIIHVGKDSGSNEHKNDVSSVFGSVEVSKGKTVTDVSSVNGNVRLKDDVTASQVDSVNGNIKVGDNVSVRSLETVNGNITVGHHFDALKSVKTVNGSISLGHSSTVGNSVETINGDIELEGTVVKRNVATHNGSISLTDQTHVYGDIIFAKKNRNSKNGWNSSLPVLKIEQGVQVDGDIVLNREVELDIEDAELLRKVIYSYNQHKE